MRAALAPVTVIVFPTIAAVTPVEPVPVTVPTLSAPSAVAVPLVTKHVALAVAAFPCCTDSVIVGFDRTIVGAATAATVNATLTVRGELEARGSVICTVPV